jgi:hypothetical protein
VSEKKNPSNAYLSSIHQICVVSLLKDVLGASSYIFYTGQMGVNPASKFDLTHLDRKLQIEGEIKFIRIIKD